MSLLPSRFFLDDFFGDMDSFYTTNKNSLMQCDIYEKDGKCFIASYLPGFEKKDINIDYSNGILTIDASRSHEEKEENKNYIRRERSFGKYSRSFNVGDINSSDIKAEFNDGELIVSLPSTENVETKKKIEIE